MPSLDIKTIADLDKIWKLKNWQFSTNDEKLKSYDLMCEMISKLPIVTQQLVLIMIQEYRKYTLNDYLPLMHKALSQLTEVQLQSVERLIFAPLNNEFDDKRGKAKSGTLLSYLAENVVCPQISILCNIKISSLATITAIPNFKDDKKTLIILLDDFIGSGATADNAIKYCSKLLNKNDEIIVVSLVIMEEAISYILGKHDIPILYGDLLKKGIADNTFITNKADAYSMIDSIESDLQITNDYKRGYKNSESLVTMIRTPDNTFPMYWCNKKTDNSMWPAPFPR